MSMRGPVSDLPALLRQVAGMDRVQCRHAWKQAFRTDPPKYLSVPFMRQVLAHDLQCRKHGGYPASVRRILKKALAGADVAATAQPVGAGAMLVREWNGRLYRVEVLPDGYLLDGKTYASLSAVARHITGAHWSGPRFFGLTNRKVA